MNICVFCSSSNSVDPIFFQEAKKLGDLIGKNSFGLVYGGTNVGLMNEVAQSAKSSGSKVLGIIPKLIKDYGISADFLDELLVTPDMAERKKLLREKSNAFIALPGGFGTLEELLEVITLKQLGYHNQPIVIINTQGFYNNLKAQFEQLYQTNFAKLSYQKLFVFVEDSEQAIEYIKSYKFEKQSSKWD